MKIGIAIVHFGKDEQLTCKEDVENAPENFDHIIRNNNLDNIGFSAGNNDVIKSFLKRPDCKWIWLLNNDTIVPESTFKWILSTLPNLDEKVGIVGFQIRSMKDKDFIHHAGTGDCYPAGQHKVGSAQLKQFQERTNERWVTFASVLIRREVFEEIGLLDAKMFNYYSDSDFCYRARYAGFKVIYEPNFIIYHKIGSSQHPNEKQAQQIRMDSIYFENKWINNKAFFDLDKELV